MPLTPTESYTAALARQTFLGLWSYPNPHRARGKEFADLLVIFGDDVIVFSDKATAFQSCDLLVAWSRWYRETVTASVKQLTGAVRHLTALGGTIYVDPSASSALPFSLPPVEQRRLHLVGVVHPDRRPGVSPASFEGLKFDSRVAGGELPFRVGPIVTNGLFVHIVQGTSLAILLEELDTVSDFVTYLRHRETAIKKTPADLTFDEPDFLALALESYGANVWAPIELPSPQGEGTIIVQSGLWNAYKGSTARVHRKHSNELSYNIDRLIEHFHEEYVSGRYLQVEQPTYESHESALRLMASESRFGRRIIAAALNESMIDSQNDRNTFWASTVESRDVPGTRYVWLIYPPFKSVPLEAAEFHILEHLKQYAYVTRAMFVADTIIGIALPQPHLSIPSVFLIVFDGTRWDEAAQAEADELQKATGIFNDLRPFHHLHIP